MNFADNENELTTIEKLNSLMKYFPIYFILFIALNVAHGQSFGQPFEQDKCLTCRADNDNLAYKEVDVLDSRICIGVCYDKEARLGSQSFRWGVRNKTGNKLEIKFTKQYILQCTKVVEKKVHIFVEPNELLKGENFSGDLDLQDAFFKEDCEGKNKVSSFTILHLEIKEVK